MYKVEVYTNDKKDVYEVEELVNARNMADAIYEATKSTVKVIDDKKMVVYTRETRKNAFLGLSKEEQEDRLMKTAMRIMDLYTGLYTDFTDYMIMLSSFTEWARDFEYSYYGSSEYDTEYLALTERVFTKKIAEKYKDDDRACKKNGDGNRQVCMGRRIVCKGS